MKFLHFFTLAFLIHGVPSCSFAKQTLNVNPSGYAVLTSANFVTSAVVSESFSVPVAKMLSLIFSKSGIAAGTLKLQGSPDNSNWKDVNTTTYPDATATLASNASSAIVSLIANPFPYIRYVFTEGGTGNGTAVNGRITTK